ncbi:MAG: hypothetical protein WC492_02045 [Candidatus Micrarchaeia archaeon]
MADEGNFYYILSAEPSGMKNEGGEVVGAKGFVYNMLILSEGDAIKVSEIDKKIRIIKKERKEIGIRNSFSFGEHGSGYDERLNVLEADRKTIIKKYKVRLIYEDGVEEPTFQRREMVLQSVMDEMIKKSLFSKEEATRRALVG